MILVHFMNRRISTTINTLENYFSYEISKKTGYKTAVTSDLGCVKFGDDPLALKRMATPQNPDQLRWYIATQREVFNDETRKTIIFKRV